MGSNLRFEWTLTTNLDNAEAKKLVVIIYGYALKMQINKLFLGKVLIIKWTKKRRGCMPQRFCMNQIFKFFLHRKTLAATAGAGGVWVHKLKSFAVEAVREI